MNHLFASCITASLPPKRFPRVASTELARCYSVSRGLRDWITNCTVDVPRQVTATLIHSKTGKTMHSCNSGHLREIKLEESTSSSLV